MESSRSNDGVQEVDVSALLMQSSSDGLSNPDTTTNNEQLISERIFKRAARKAEIKEMAEKYKRAGDFLYESKNYKGAHSRYLDAIHLMGNVPEYYICLALAYRKLTWYEEAAHAATRALTIDPKNLEARYVRGVARLEQRLMHAAQTDFEAILEHDPTHLRTLAAIGEVRQFLSQSGLEFMKQENASIVDFGFPHWDYEALEVASVSDSSDCQHVGNGVPCRFYNHDGCGKGIECVYSHAPDEKSVRDDLGKNVCIYHILDSCKFGASRCVYSHSKAALPKIGWWNSPEKVAKVKDVLEVAERNARKQRQAEMDKWKVYLKEMRSEAKARHATDKQLVQSGDVNEKAGNNNKARKAPIDSTKKKEDPKKESKDVGTVEEVKNAGDVTAGKKAKVKKRVVESQSGDGFTISNTPAVKKKNQNHRHHPRRKSPKTGTAQSGEAGNENINWPTGLSS